MEVVGIFYAHFGEFSGHLAYLMAIWYILHRSGTFLPVFGMLYQYKSGNNKNKGKVLLFVALFNLDLKFSIYLHITEKIFALHI
jgi:hypothetical protein